MSPPTYGDIHVQYVFVSNVKGIVGTKLVRGSEEVSRLDRQ
jgi:hypothetical protein